MSTFQQIILDLQNFWAKKGCIFQQSHDLQTGAGTFNPETFLRALGPEPYNVCHVEISRRPTDGRYGENPNRLQRFHQFQVMMKPTPSKILEFYLESLEAIGFTLSNHDIRFVHDDWESPTQGAAGLGWEVWCDGMEITQFTYFQQIGGISLTQIPAELAYGIERIALFLQKKENVYDLAYNQTLTYGDVFLSAEKQYSRYNFEEASVKMWQDKFEACEKESTRLIALGLPIPAYDMAIETSHSFNMLQARGAISTTARVEMIHRVRDLCCNAAKAYLVEREKEGFPLLKNLDPYKQKVLKPVEVLPQERTHFLLEIGTEPLPEGAIKGAVSSLKTLFETFLADQEIVYETVDAFATPRRLSLLVHGINTYTQGGEVEKKGPSIESAFDKEGNVTKQGAGFFNSIGLNILTIDQLDQETSIGVKDSKLVFFQKKDRLFIGPILQHHLKGIILAITFPKKMRWGNEGVLFSRPIASLVALLGDVLIDLEIEGVVSSRDLQLHSQMVNKTVAIQNPLDYGKILSKGKVLVDVSERKAFIDKQLKDISDAYNCEIVLQEEVSSSVLFLSEYPILAVGEFDQRFLTLPEELIFSEMIDHQRYYPMKKKGGGIAPTFVVALDKEPTAEMIKNYENVLRARLSDGLFLFKKDLNGSFDEWNKKLSDVALHPKLGSVYNKVERIVILSQRIGALLQWRIDPKAALYCKADLVSEVVYEFAELQGVMGKYYAPHFGLGEEVGVAIEESYLPKCEGGKLPQTKGGIVLALADRLDNLLSYIGIGLIPTSSKDPYALRRAAVGLLKILIEHKLSLDLNLLINDPKVMEFVIGRMPALLKEYGFSNADIEMCALYNSCNPYRIFQCVEAISHLKKNSHSFSQFMEIYKRMKGSVQGSKGGVVLENLLIEPQEKELYSAIQATVVRYHLYADKGNYREAFETLLQLLTPLDQFFSHVRVQTSDSALQQNRVTLLSIPYTLISKSLNL